mmetsp:Transcript_22450/g.28331  ORF Transcript_22450/g.28331 Transcript_22450/m.28331 type:complete len:448 (-) Transcript_22450:67-1410(-)|eukprot:CAMPEP_0203663038 /NCGR_PEP_ID=MMETSP0090-20130426/790_1 /ASSEMBLY_ACC=CAM_ASM_001088 /TAXON_ID=426623 /ORGANISM="Chaetoceros affinis, Strain CCMP159" /LENGTH=447 /DNA_ID=CAMNT_0050525901 /DNA_START=44 /DNA_END=1390 /DNA_ORIENTATION=+
MNLSSSSPFSAHNDVLNASPSTTDEKRSLIEELKRRGRISVTSKRYPDARDLYTKAIDTLTSINKEGDKDNADSKKNDNDLAILFSNRSLCNLQMNKTSDSYDDAMSATCHDDSYVKGFWRLGQAAMALKRTEEALIAYEKALALDESSKALKKECEKAKKQLEAEKKEKEEAEKKAEEAKANGEKNESETKPPVSKPKKTTSTVSSSSSSKKEEKKEISSEGDFSKSDHVRGYKVVNGKKTSFFHHEQTDEEKRLIGDITPKRIDQQQLLPEQTGPTKIEENKGTSAWNKAGTWEEKDVTDWAIKSMEDTISQCEYDLPEGSPDPNAHVQVTKVTKLLSAKVAGGTCHASVATVRGKKRYIFEFTICVHWEMTLGDGRKCKGHLTFLDVDGTHELGEGFDVSDYTVDSDTPSEARYLLQRFVRDGGFRNEVEKSIDGWITLFRETY